MCEQPEILPTNEEAVNLWSQVAGQYIMGSAGPIALDIKTVKVLMDLNDVTDQLTCLRKLMVIASVIIQRINDEIRSKE